MTPKFAQAVDPIFLYVLAMLDRISREEPLSPETERSRIRTLIDKAEASLGAGEEWDLAKYALVSWVDEMLVETFWNGREWWSENVMEIDLFNTRQCNEEFFLKAHKAAQQRGRDALEVFYVCVILGFRGLYHEPDSGAEIARSLNLPPRLKDWTKQVAESIRLAGERPRLVDPGPEIVGAPPLRSRAVVVWPWLTALLMGVIGIVVVFYWS
jgi:type VI secretion system protein ImpK